MSTGRTFFSKNSACAVAVVEAASCAGMEAALTTGEGQLQKIATATATMDADPKETRCCASLAFRVMLIIKDSCVYADAHTAGPLQRVNRIQFVTTQDRNCSRQGERMTGTFLRGDLLRDDHQHEQQSISSKAGSEITGVDFFANILMYLTMVQNERQH